MFTISAKIFYATYAILIISPRFGIAYKQLCLDVSCNNSSSQQFRLGKWYLFGLEIVCVYLSVSCSRCALHAVVVHIFSKIMCTRSFTLFTIHIPIRVESFAERCFVSELLASPFLAPLIASSVQHRHQQHCANYLNTLCMHAVKYFDVFGMVFFEQQQPR